MKYLALALSLISFSALACWNLKADLQTGSDKVSFNQKMEHDKTYSIPAGPYVFHIKMPSQKNYPPKIPGKPGAHLVLITVEEKQGMSISQVAAGSMLVNSGKEATMTVSNQENSALESKFTVKLTEI